MKVSVNINTKSKAEKITVVSDSEIDIKISTPPVDGKANKRVIEMLARHFGVSKSKVTVVGGLKSKKKLVDIEL